MREILFRGKDANSKKWRIGDLVQTLMYDKYFYRITVDDGKYISNYSVKENTIGQYTGIDDVHGNKVYEGDIVKVHDNMIGVEDGAEDFIGVVYYRDGSFMIITPYQLHYRWMDYTVEVIGNKFDNPEIWEEL